MSNTEDRNYVKRVRERMRRRSYRLVEQYRPSAKVWEWWWVNAISHKAEHGPYESPGQACKTAERQGLDAAGIVGGRA